MLQIGTAALLVCTQDQPDAMAQTDAQLRDSPHGIECRNSRSLVIRCSSSIEIVIFLKRLKGLRFLPVLRDRYDIEMRQNVQALLSISGKICCNAVVVIVMNLKPL